MISHLRYVVRDKIAAYEAIGWVDTHDLDGTHHGFHATLMKWTGEGEPREP